MDEGRNERKTETITDESKKNIYSGYRYYFALKLGLDAPYSLRMSSI